LKLTTASNFGRNTTLDIVTSTDFQGLDNVLYYGDRIFTPYIADVKSNLEDVIRAQITEVYVFLAEGFVVFTFGCLLARRKFMKYFDEQYCLAKNICRILPFDIISSNTLLMKWLKDNSDKNT